MFGFLEGFVGFVKNLRENPKTKQDQTHIQAQGAQGPSERGESKAAGEDRERRQGERGDTRRTGTERARGEPQGRSEREDGGEEGETQGEQGLGERGGKQRAAGDDREKTRG